MKIHSAILLLLGADKLFFAKMLFSLFFLSLHQCSSGNMFATGCKYHGFMPG